MAKAPRDAAERQLSILFEIIQYYLDRHEAISARTLSKFSSLDLSPTTIRNLMEDLSSDGFLTSEGVTRGRIPTQKAFVFFVSHLPEHPEPPPSQPQAFSLREEEDGEPLPLEEALERTGRRLSQARPWPGNNLYRPIRLITFHPRPESGSRG